MKHKLSETAQAAGIRKALRSRKTPKWLKPSMKRYLEKLEGRFVGRGQKGGNGLDLLGL
jgi:hypothetical protein